MQLSEFKAWFEGFTESMNGPPNAQQWERIKSKFKEIDGNSITYPVFIGRYVYPCKYWWEGNKYHYSSGVGFNSLEAMNYAGKAEYASV